MEAHQIPAAPVVLRPRARSPPIHRPVPRRPSKPVGQASDVALREALVYARKNKIIIDYHSYADPAAILKQCREMAASVGSRDVCDDGDLTPFRLPDIIFPPQAIETSAKSLELLHRTYQDFTRQDSHAEGLQTEMIRVCSIRAKKLELPLLRTDPEADSLELLRRIDTFRHVNLTNHRLPQEPADREADEALEFPEKAGKVGKEVMRALRSEMVDVSREAMRCLRDSLADPWTAEDQRALMRAELTYKRVWYVDLTGYEKMPNRKPTDQCREARHTTSHSTIKSVRAVRS